MGHKIPEGESPRWIDHLANVRKLFRGLWVVCLLLLVGGEALLVWAHHRDVAEGVAHHGFAFESWPGFYPLFGLAAYVTLVLLAKQLRPLVMRSEDYYDD
jgi:hypothetical protein